MGPRMDAAQNLFHVKKQLVQEALLSWVILVTRAIPGEFRLFASAESTYVQTRYSYPWMRSRFWMSLDWRGRTAPGRRIASGPTDEAKGGRRTEMLAHWRVT